MKNVKKLFLVVLVMGGLFSGFSDQVFGMKRKRPGCCERVRRTFWKTLGYTCEACYDNKSGVDWLSRQPDGVILEILTCSLDPCNVVTYPFRYKQVILDGLRGRHTSIKAHHGLREAIKFLVWS